jgi:hypothetical protein
MRQFVRADPVFRRRPLPRKLCTLFRHRCGVAKGAIEEFCGSVEQLADAQVGQHVLAGEAVYDVIGDVALSVSKLLV